MLCEERIGGSRSLFVARQNGMADETARGRPHRIWVSFRKPALHAPTISLTSSTPPVFPQVGKHTNWSYYLPDTFP
jgi:hypothetical protein